VIIAGANLRWSL